jgi:hypothetical protein
MKLRARLAATTEHPSGETAMPSGLMPVGARPVTLFLPFSASKRRAVKVPFGGLR